MDDDGKMDDDSTEDLTPVSESPFRCVCELKCNPSGVCWSLNCSQNGVACSPVDAEVSTATDESTLPTGVSTTTEEDIVVGSMEPTEEDIVVGTSSMESTDTAVVSTTPVSASTLPTQVSTATEEDIVVVTTPVPDDCGVAGPTLVANVADCGLVLQYTVLDGSMNGNNILYLFASTGSGSSAVPVSHTITEGSNGTVAIQLGGFGDGLTSYQDNEENEVVPLIFTCPGRYYIEVLSSEGEGCRASG
eukprot:CAMPEP_0198149814 /NCGR_PEP_ID=MMETSP1443-20131203/48276_1 /TAXON_ID=186043 /ORGANISM="Entomoneis sp., Strain CCMP2396" /LENGTH=246 /DNA_ID=CAMNT_0043814947 /DNA_START=266 /DNA_END=1003 /DNA_ORIENTATION=-